ncbi:hypothetical protein Lal_00049725 [Lupinus albus]|nr:hypothetical protein Lal_00049725 [Lupinus albus]
MASSSRSKKQCSNVTQTKQGTSSLESNPLDLTRLLANDEQHKVFEEHFHGRTIFTPKFGNTTVFGLACQWDIYDRREFYYSLCRISKEEIEMRKKHGFGATDYMIMRQMWTVRGTQSPLPYAIFITNILEHFGVSTTGETKVALNLRESKIDVEVVHKMGFSIDHRDRRNYNHRTDRPVAPTDQPELANPNHSEFYAQTSSSAAMPSNQMIMY